MRGQNISEFLKDPETMMEFRGAWQDGQSAVSWLTGTHIGYSWVKERLQNYYSARVLTKTKKNKRILRRFVGFYV